MNSAEESKERAICSGISLHKSVQDFNGGKWFFGTLKCIQESLIPSSQPWGLEPIAPGFRTLGSAGSTPGSVLLQHHSSSSSPQPCFVLGSLPWYSLEDIFKICLPLSKATQNDYLPAEGRADQWSLIMPFGWILLYYLSGNWLVLTALCFFKSVWEGLRTCSGRQQVEKACELPAACCQVIDEDHPGLACWAVPPTLSWAELPCAPGHCETRIETMQHLAGIPLPSHRAQGGHLPPVTVSTVACSG